MGWWIKARDYNSFHNYISYFLNSLRRDIKALSDFLVKFFMQNIFQILSGYFSRAKFLLRIFKNVRIIKSCYGLICGEKISQRKKFILINLIGNLHRNAFCNLHDYIFGKNIFKYLSSLSDEVSLRWLDKDLIFLSPQETQLP